MTSRQLDEETIFHTARNIAHPRAREEYLDQICAGDMNLRERVEALLQAHGQDDGFLKSADEPAPTIGAPVTEGPGTVIGRYKLLQTIGEGGFGVVFMAEQQTPVVRKVALKVIKPGMDSKAVVARFEAERQALALMDHPNIAHILDGGVTDSGRPYFVMELVKGIPITEYCDKNELSTEERLRLFTDVCKAVQHAHQKGVIHRDLKPSNILVTLHDGKPVPRVIDFGVSKALHQRLTEKTLFTAFGQMIGTAQYMSPEQAEMSGLDVDTRSDVYSLGVLLYELLTGTTPLEAASLREAGYAEIQRMIKETEPPRPSVRLSTEGERLTAIAKHRSIDPNGLRRLLQGDLDWIAMKALEKDRTRRYETASGLAVDVQRLLANEPIEAKPPSTTYLLSKFIARNRRPMVVASCVVLALVIGVFIAGTGWHKSKQSERAALAERARAEKLLNELRDELFDKALFGVMAMDARGSEWIDKARRVEVSPHKLEILEGLQTLYSGHPEEAIPHFELAVKCQDGSVAANALLATAYNLVGRYTEWGQACYKLKQMPPESPEDYLFKAQAMMVVVNPEQAMALADEAVKRRRSPLAFAIRAEVGAWFAIHVDSPEQALLATEDIRAARLMIGDCPYVLQLDLFTHLVAMILAGENRGELHDRLKRKADDAAKQLGGRFAAYTPGRVVRASYLDFQGNVAEAEAEWQTVVDRDEKPSFVLSHALMLYRQGRIEESSDELTGLRLCFEQIVGIPILLESEGERDTARKILNQSVARTSTDPACKEDFVLRGMLYLAEIDTAKQLAREWSSANRPSTANSGLWPSWTAGKLRYLANTGDPGAVSELLKLAGNSRILLCDAYCLFGTQRLAEGDKKQAEDWFRKSVATGVIWFSPYMLSKAILSRMSADANSDSNWPHWPPFKSKHE